MNNKYTNNNFIIESSKIELLAPAGDYSCFLAAINAGADAVYLSGEKYGARAYAKNFSQEELISAIDYAHVFDRKVFLTVNTLLKDEELDELFDYLYPFYIAGLDGVIVQDLGVITYIRNAFPGLAVHASTQLAITGLDGIKLLEREGVKRVVLAREVTLSEIEYIHKNSDMEIETFVHGALCYSYSGKCLFSSLVGGRSGNRGRCAGSCRQPYNEKYVLSTKDICCLPIIPDLIKAGICSLKIEGRMKSPEYVAGVTSVYRKYIDLFYKVVSGKKVSDELIKDIKKSVFSGKEFNNDLNMLISLYTRGGNSQGYYFKHNGRDMITLSDASYKSEKGDIKSHINEEYIANSNRIPLKAWIRIYPNEPVSLLINNEYYSEGNLALTAEKNPITADSVKKQLSKTKDTEFFFEDIEYDIAENAFVRISDLNELRRQAISGYRDSLLTKYRRIDDCTKTNNDLVKTYSSEGFITEKPSVSAEISTLNQFNSVICIADINRIYCSYDLLVINPEIITRTKQCNKEIYIKFQSVIRYNFLEKNKAHILDILNKVDGVLADSHELIYFLIINGFNKPVIGDIHIYGLNNTAVAKYKSIGINSFTVPIELNKKELIRRGINNEELIIYGYLPMMISAQCVNNTLSGCSKSYSEIRLKDRKGAEFIAVNDCMNCISTIYNNVPLSLHSEISIMDKLKPSSVRLIFTIEDERRTKEVSEFFCKLINNSDNKINCEPVFNENTYTKGHLGRGVL